MFRLMIDWTNECIPLVLCCLRYNGDVIGNRYGAGSGTILLDDVACTGRETDFTQCRHRGWESHNCQHSMDVSISCGNFTFVFLCSAVCFCSAVFAFAAIDSGMYTT